MYTQPEIVMAMGETWLTAPLIDADGVYPRQQVTQYRGFSRVMPGAAAIDREVPPVRALLSIAHNAGRPALFTGREREERRPKTRRRLLSPHEPERSGTGRLPSRWDQSEDQAKTSWRTHAGAIGGGSTANFRCRRMFRITSPCVLAAMIYSAPR
jgi:hypothetical protein